jgi:tetratricopeptide (TPR) repeat protein
LRETLVSRRPSALLRSLALFCVALGVLLRASPAWASSCDELVRLAHAHEASGEPDVALRQYTDALSIDATCRAAWLGLGALRARMGDAAEAERVFDAALQHVPTLGEATLGRARTRWALGRREEAEGDMQRYVEVAASADVPAALQALQELAGWYRTIGRAPAELACWRRIADLAAPLDAPVAARARAAAFALEIVVGDADPVHRPPRRDLLRNVVATLRLRRT